MKGSGARIVVGLILLYLAWLGMMAAHEAGHVLHAWASGGRVLAVSMPWAGFSQTFVDPNPKPRFVAWGGPIWGCVLPAAAWTAWEIKRWPGRKLLRFFTGFCCISNGAYLGAGWARQTGDAADLIRLGTPVWALIGFGLALGAGGLYLWHTLGSPRALLGGSGARA